MLLYFDRAVGTFLLYRFERAQFEALQAGAAMSMSMSASASTSASTASLAIPSLTTTTASSSGFSPCDVFGVEHLLRVLVKLPHLLSLARLDPSDSRIMQARLGDLAQFLARKQARFFGADYTRASPEYVRAWAVIDRSSRAPWDPIHVTSAART